MSEHEIPESPLSLQEILELASVVLGEKEESLLSDAEEAELTLMCRDSDAPFMYLQSSLFPGLFSREASPSM